MSGKILFDEELLGQNECSSQDSQQTVMLQKNGTPIDDNEYLTSLQKKPLKQQHVLLTRYIVKKSRKHMYNFKSLECSKCQKKYQNKFIFFTHLKNIHSILPNKCRSCEKSFNTVKELKDHIRNEHINISKQLFDKVFENQKLVKKEFNEADTDSINLSYIGENKEKYIDTRTTLDNTQSNESEILDLDQQMQQQEIKQKQQQQLLQNQQQQQQGVILNQQEQKQQCAQIHHYQQIGIKQEEQHRPSYNEIRYISQQQQCFQQQCYQQPAPAPIYKFEDQQNALMFQENFNFYQQQQQQFDYSNNNKNADDFSIINSHKTNNNITINNSIHQQQQQELIPQNSCNITNKNNNNQQQQFVYADLQLDHQLHQQYIQQPQQQQTSNSMQYFIDNFSLI